jgi:hypothetical protein
MNLLELRRYAVRQGICIHFRCEPAGECIVNEHGVVRIPSLRGVPDFRLDTSLAGVEKFTLAPLREASRTRTVSRSELEKLIGEPAHAGAEAED